MISLRSAVYFDIPGEGSGGKGNGGERGKECEGNNLCDNTDLFTNFRAYCKAKLTSGAFQKGRHKGETDLCLLVFIFRCQVFGFFLVDCSLV